MGVKSPAMLAACRFWQMKAALPFKIKMPAWKADGLFTGAVLAGLVLCLFTFLPAFAAESVPLQVETQVVAEKTHKGKMPLIALWVTVGEGYYAYAHGEEHGRPLEVRVASGGTVKADILYPAGKERIDFFEPDIHIRALSGRFPIFVRLRALPDAALPSSLNVVLSMLLCSPTRCIPVDRQLSILLPDTSLLPPLSDFPALSAMLYPENAEAAFAEETENASPVQTEDWNLSPRYAQQKLEPDSLWMALLLGIPAGLVLNVMPCVLPVLTLKLTGLLGAAGGGGISGRRRRFRRYNLAFSAGILVWFGCLAAAFGWIGMLWGDIFRQPVVVMSLAVLIFLMALSLFGIFMLPMPGIHLSAAEEKHPVREAFVSGLLVTLLATPCSGPLLGGVLGWAAMQPSGAQGLVFGAVGLGMAMPYLLLALFPEAAVRFLPRPGRWMGFVARIAGVLLLATTAYLLSILPRSQWKGALLTLIIASAAAWCWNRWAGLDASRKRRWAAWGLGCAGIACAMFWTLRISPAVASVGSFSPSEFRENLGLRNMLVEFTADWCPSCKVLERTVLNPKSLDPLLKQYNLSLIRVDLTRPDMEADSLLRALGSVSIPVVAIFPAGKQAREPLVLRDLFTAGQLRQALSEAFDQR